MLLTLPVVLLSVALAAQANLAHDGHAIARHHQRVSVPKAPLEAPRKRKSCNRKHSFSVKPTSTHHATSTTTHKTTTEKKKTNTANFVKPTTPAKQAETPVSNNQAASGLIRVSGGQCPNNGATKKTTGTTGPNGSIDWLNCGVTGGGWNPPHVKVSDIKVVDLNDALKDPNTPFTACKAFTGYFYKYAGEFGLQPIMLAAFAMQESSCNPQTVGGGGEQGLMQITKEKCGGAPGGNCRDPDFNIRTGAKYFAQTLNDNGGNVLLAVGQYNGWYQGLTKDGATAARWSKCCRCQNNLDYLHQYFNGWLQNVNAYYNHLGKYFNLDVCPEY